jgi:DNA modification methylase
MAVNDWTLHLGDFFEGCEDCPTVDHAIFDPPYSEHVHSKSMRGANGWKGDISVKRELGFDAITEEQISSMAAICSTTVRRWTLVFSDVESSHLWREAFQRNGLEYVRTLAWIKVGGAPQFTGDRPGVGFEAITVAHPKGKKRWNGGGKQGVYECPIVLDRGDGERRVHTTQKPEELMSSLIRDFTNPGDLILDPFAGSGTTGVAALRNGRRFIGWERDPKYHAVASKRLAATREQRDLFEVRP